MKVLRLLGKTLRVLLVTAGVLAALLVGGAVLGLLRPELLLNPQTLRLGAVIAGRFGVILTWDEARVRIDSKRLFQKRIDLGFDRLCFNLSENRYQGCIGELQLSVEAAWLGGFRVLEVGPLRMERADLSLHLTKSPETEPSSPEPFNLKIPHLVLPEFLKGTYFHPISLQWKRLTLWQEGKRLFTGPLRLEMTPDGQGRPQSLSLQLELEEGRDLPAGNLQATLSSPSNFWLNDWTLQVRAQASLRGKGAGEAELRLTPVRPEVYSIGLRGKGSFGKTRGNADLDATLSDGDLRGRVSMEVRGLTERVHGVSAQGCGFHVQQLAARRDRMRLNLNCPLRVDVTPVQLPSPAGTKLVTLPQNLDFILKTELETKFFPSLNDPVAGTLDLEMVPISRQLIDLKGKALTRFSGVPARFPEGWSALTEIDVFAKILRFQNLVQTLEKTAYAVFAPLNELKGQLELGISGETDLIHTRGELPVVFRSRLASRTQSFNVDGEGVVKFDVGGENSKTELNLELTPTDVKLVMPGLGLQALPQIFPDGRFVDPKKTVEASSSDLSYNVKIVTPPKQPIRLISNLTQEAIPLFLDLQVDEKKLGGTVTIGRTPLSILRRNVSIREFAITLADPTEFSELNGTLRVDYSNYDIDILVRGTMKRPRVIFESHPPLSQEEIISVLIYGQPYDALDASQSNSVGSVASAVADRALRLSSLFLLASTPVESVGYNPATGYVSARFRLGGGASLEVGTEGGHTQRVGLRKNIGGNWIINTYIENDSDEGAQRGGAFLDWYKRY